MTTGLNTPFVCVNIFQEEIKRNRNNITSAEGIEWLTKRYKQTSFILQTEKSILLKWNDNSTSEPVNFPETVTKPTALKVVFNTFKFWWFSLKLARLARIEKRYEETRCFFELLQTFQKMKSLCLKMVDEDLGRFKTEIKNTRSDLLNFSYSKPDLKPAPLTNITGWLPAKLYRVPYFRNLKFIFFQEQINSAKIIEAVNVKLFSYYKKQFANLLNSFDSSAIITKEYLGTLQAYSTEDVQDVSSFAQREKDNAERLVDSFTKDFMKAFDKSSKEIEFRIVEIIDTIVSLRSRRWLTVKRLLLVSDMDKLSNWYQNQKNRYRKYMDQKEEKLGLWVNESLKPAMGLTQKVSISSSAFKLHEQWLKVPDIPSEFSEVMLDRQNPSLIIIPEPVVNILRELRQYYKNNGCGNLLYITDHQTGSVGLIGYLVRQEFKDYSVRIYRHNKTTPISKLAEFKEDIIIVDDFERMIYLDEKNIDKAQSLVSQIMGSQKLVILSVHHALVKQLKLAIPGFSRFLFQLDFSKYSFESFKKVIMKRMVISGYQFEYNDENDFWLKLYEESSGIPGVGLRIFLRCIKNVNKQTIQLEYNLPSLKEYLSKLTLDEKLLLKRIYMHPKIDINLLGNGNNDDLRLVLSNLKSMGIILENNGLFEIRPELLGALRDILIQINLI